MQSEYLHYVYKMFWYLKLKGKIGEPFPSFLNIHKSD